MQAKPQVLRRSSDLGHSKLLHLKAVSHDATKILQLKCGKKVEAAVNSLKLESGASAWSRHDLNQKRSTLQWILIQQSVFSAAQFENRWYPAL
jgi:hypothetical protein